MMYQKENLYKIILSQRYSDFVFVSLRLSLGIIFIWFGLLKVLGFNPVYDLIYNSLVPFFADGSGLILIGGIEMAIGGLLIVDKAVFITHFLLLAHLLGTFSTFIFGFGVIFDPFFPVLSLDGEFVVKNMVLVLSGLAVLSYETKKIKSQHE